jgi:hypothetical protein
MLMKLGSRLTYANVMATLAVFIALGGSSYAALRITGRDVRDNSLTGADIKNLTGKDVRNNSLTGADVRNLTSADVSNRSLLAEDFAAGQLPKGEKGDRGASGATSVVVHTADGDPVPSAADSNVIVAMCGPGERATGGGGQFSIPETGDVVIRSSPTNAARTIAVAGEIPVGWATRLHNGGTDPDFVRAYVVCAAP